VDWKRRCEPNVLSKGARREEMEDCFFLGLTVNTCWDDGVNSGCNNGSCREDVPSYFPEHEFVSSINFGFPEGFPFGLGESASGVKSGMLVSEVNMFFVVKI
jgi:hypothetical protein